MRDFEGSRALKVGFARWPRILLLAGLVFGSVGCDEGSEAPTLCDQVTCGGHGACLVVQGAPSCLCEPGYHAEGLNCVEDGTTGPCYEVDCSGHGQCVEVAGSPTCQCFAGYHPEGLACVEDPVDPCDGVTCSGHGQCVEANGSATCNCNTGYHPEGLSCVVDVDPCLGVDCGPNGACVPDAGQPTCLCDEGYEPDGLTCAETLCHCRERTSSPYSYCAFTQSCTTAADCCPANLPAGLTCNGSYPYVYECRSGLCETQNCTQDSHCAAYVTYLNSVSAVPFTSLGCLEVVDDCTGEIYYRYCDIRQACQQPADCCPAGLADPYDCLLDYTYRYDCVDGACLSLGCSANAQCTDYFTAMSAADPTGYLDGGCLETQDPCTGAPGYSACQVFTTCSTAADCCPANVPATFTCLLDYPYLYECVDGRCKTGMCESDGQCEAYYQQVSTSNPTYDVNLGCQTF